MMKHLLRYGLCLGVLTAALAGSALAATPDYTVDQDGTVNYYDYGWNRYFNVECTEGIIDGEDYAILFVEAELDPILNKLVACCTPAQNLKAVQELIGNERFHYVPPHHGKKFVDKLWQLGEAIRDHKVIEMDYVGTHNGTSKHRRVEPVGILFSEYYFYLAAFIEGIDKQEHFADPADKSPTIYRVDRIERFTVTADRFTVPYKDRFQEGEMRKRIQFMYGGKLRRIQFKYTGPNIEAVLDRLPTARMVEELPDGGKLVEAEVFDGNGLDMWLRSQGEWVEMYS